MRDAMDSRRHLLQAFLFVVFGVYFVWFWSKGQTLAMKTWGIRVVDRLGRPVTQGARCCAICSPGSGSCLRWPQSRPSGSAAASPRC